MVSKEEASLWRFRQQIGYSRLTRDERRSPEVEAIGIEQVEGIEGEPIRTLRSQLGL